MVGLVWRLYTIAEGSLDHWGFDRLDKTSTPAMVASVDPDVLVVIEGVWKELSYR